MRAQPLRAFTAGRTIWPSPQQFLAAGRSRLYRQMQLRGGDRHWANQLGLLPYRPRAIHWPNEKIRAALTEYLKDKDAWPTSSQFRADHQTSLCAAITNAGGVHLWATEFGMHELNPRNRGPIPYWTTGASLDESCAGAWFVRAERERLRAPADMWLRVAGRRWRTSSAPAACGRWR